MLDLGLHVSGWEGGLADGWLCSEKQPGVGWKVQFRACDRCRMGVDLDGEAFDVLTWVNGKLPSHDSESLVLEVREEWEAAQGELSAALSMALTAVPQSVKEADRVMQMGTGLMDGVDRVSTRVEGVETGAEEAVAAIANADAVLRRVERARDMLARAAEVETLTERIEVCKNTEYTSIRRRRFGEL